MSAETPWWTRSESRQMESSGPHRGGGGFGHADGGSAPAEPEHLQAGGMSTDSPWWERSDARQINDVPFHSGLINSGVAGRTDRLPLATGVDSHVIPADVISGLGQGNTLAGARILNEAMSKGPFGVPLPHGARGHGPPQAPHVSAQTMGLAGSQSGGLASGGQDHEKTSILAAGGEYVISPEEVRDIGGGDMDKGHRLLDAMIKRVREHTIKFLRTAPPPKA